MPIRVKYFQKTSFHPIIENFIEKFFPKLIIRSDVERAVLFSTFGTESKALENYINYNLKHSETKNTLSNSTFLNNNLIKEKSEKLGLKLIDILK